MELHDKQCLEHCQEFLFFFTFIIVCRCEYDLVIRKILDLDPSRITVFRSERKERKKLFKTSMRNSSQEIENKRRSSSTDLHIVVQNVLDFNVQRIENGLNTIAKLNFSPPRSKLLPVLIRDRQAMSLNFDKLFTDAWDLKFLDSSVSTVNGSADSTVDPNSLVASESRGSAEARARQIDLS